MAFELPVVDAASLAAWCDVHRRSPAESELFRAGHFTRVIGTRLADRREVVVRVRLAAPRSMPGWGEGCRPRRGFLHRLPVVRVEARQRRREDAVLLLVNVSTQERQRRGQPVRPGWVLWSAGGCFSEHRCNLLVLGLQDGYLVRELGCERGEQAAFLDLGMRAEDGGDPRGQVGHPRPVSLGPGYPGFADQAEHHIMLPGQITDRRQGLAAAALARVASFRWRSCSFPLCTRGVTGEPGAKVPPHGRDRQQLHV